MALKWLLIIFVIAQPLYSPWALKIDSNKHWKNFKTTYNKSYTPEQEKIRFAIFEESLVYVIKHNFEGDLGLHSYHLGINHLSDITQEEYLEKYQSKIHENFVNPSIFDSCNVEAEIPDEVDYVEDGLVTEVKNQGDCKGGYAMASIASVEGAWKKSGGELVNLSSQSIVDCTRKGCNGGSLDTAFVHMILNGVALEKSYPYEGKAGSCQLNNSKSSEHIAVRITNFMRVTPNSMVELKKAVAAKGVIAITINIQPKTFKHYKGGVYNDVACGVGANHAVAVVGYGDQFEDKPFWLVKNSWGTGWGESGYMKILRDEANICGILGNPYYPIV